VLLTPALAFVSKEVHELRNVKDLSKWPYIFFPTFSVMLGNSFYSALGIKFQERKKLHYISLLVKNLNFQLCDFPSYIDLNVITFKSKYERINLKFNT
jgi:hypothetical protein